MSFRDATESRHIKSQIFDPIHNFFGGQCGNKLRKTSNLFTNGIALVGNDGDSVVIAA